MDFKRLHRSSSRRITQLVTRKHVESRKEIEQAAKSFVFEIDKIIEKSYPEEVLNSDQVGINLKAVGHRTLTYVGEQSTWNHVRSVSNSSHSYTIQSTITLNGTVFGPLYACLKEPSGHLKRKSEKEFV